MDVVIHHNPDCGTSRNVLAIIEAAGYRPTVIEYLKTGWTKPPLLGLFAAAGLTPRTALLETKSPAGELGLVNEDVSNDAILDAMIEYPILVNRPIVCSPKGVPRQTAKKWNRVQSPTPLFTVGYPASRSCAVRGGTSA